MVDNIERTSPTAKQPTKPYNLCILDNAQNCSNGDEESIPSSPVTADIAVFPLKELSGFQFRDIVVMCYEVCWRNFKRKHKEVEQTTYQGMNTA